ncbi:MAG: QueT transporter family protein [Clostridiales bacterium]|nr:QueT transporter family protein [Clostridiales bacterium]
MNTNTKKLVTSAVIGALYAALTMVLAPISYGSLQLRVSEVMCILPFFFPPAAFGLTIGCAIANTLSAAGILDIIFGSLASLLAGLSVAAIGKRPRALLFSSETGILKNGEREKTTAHWGRYTAACAMPVVFNGPIIGAVLAFAFSRNAFWEGFLIFSLQVALGEAAVMFLLALPLMGYLGSKPRFISFFADL